MTGQQENWKSETFMTKRLNGILSIIRKQNDDFSETTTSGSKINKLAGVEEIFNI